MRQSHSLLGQFIAPCLVGMACRARCATARRSVRLDPPVCPQSAKHATRDPAPMQKEAEGTEHAQASFGLPRFYPIPL